MNQTRREIRPHLSRRNFLKRSAAATGAALAASAARGVHAAGSDKIRVAMVGCGHRGTQDAIYCLRSAPGVELYAIADMFQDRVDESLRGLRREVPDKVNVPAGRVFLGFDACEKVLAMSEVDLVMLLTPPGFRPQHVADAVKAGKHIFMEKPGAVDPAGIRSLLRSADEADKKGLSIVVGTQQRYAPQYLEIIQRIWDGQIGEIRMLKAHWICHMVNWHFAHRQPGWSDMEWQIRCWPFFTWLSGDHLVEQLCHNIDVCNWIMKSTPESCIGLGGRQVRTGPEYGNIYDHFTVEYLYPSGLTMLAMAAQMEGVTEKVDNTIEGTRGIARVSRASASIEGEKPWRYAGGHDTGDLAMHGALIRSIREKKPINECRRLATTTLTAILGRMSTYTGLALKFDWAMNESKLELGPKRLTLGELPVEPVAMPGKTKLV
ncbi:MAG: Gfo/Idh/MocA family oxidoreductase [Planctomycetes bacterium]|nr:Gfo/Idh/MocA family oxidoreductase [Planctomycetota bacterium]